MNEVADLQTISVDFPGDLEYVPDVRRFISNLIALRGFSRRFTFRMEIVIDELCSNAVKFGGLRVGDFITLTANLGEKEVAFDVSQPSASDEVVAQLRRSIALASGESDELAGLLPNGRGMQIVKILCDSIEVKSDNGTVVSIRKRWTPNDDL